MANLVITLNLPELQALQPLDEQYLRCGLVAMLYAKGFISELQACKALDMNRREFEAMLPHYGFAAMADVYAEEDAQIEQRAS